MNPAQRFWERSRAWPWFAQVLFALLIVAAVSALVGPFAAPSDESATSPRPSVSSTLAPTSTTPTPASTAKTATTPGAVASALAPTTVAVAITSAPQAILPGGITQLVIADPRYEGYDRDLFGSGWTDADRDCQDTRAEVLIAESQIPVSFTSTSECTVSGGDWFDPWSGAESVSARALDVDHTVPLANAWRSGAWAWTPAQRIAYANDTDNPGQLIAIPLGENRSKGDDGPEGWRPPDRAAWCAYARLWTAIKARWQLSATAQEWSAILEMAGTC